MIKSIVCTNGSAKDLLINGTWLFVSLEASVGNPAVEFIRSDEETSSEHNAIVDAINSSPGAKIIRLFFKVKSR